MVDSPLIVTHADALLAAMAGMDIPVYDSDEVPDSPEFPYAVLYMDIGQWDNHRLSARTKLKVWRIVVMAVGSTAYEARYAADQIDAALSGHRLSIPGYVTTPLRGESSQPVEVEDRDVPGIYTTTAVWRFASTIGSD